MKKLLSTLLVLCMLLALLSGAALAADNTYQVKIGGTYDYDGAYEVLELLNSYRQEKGLSQLVMDKDLLAVAMQRAAETAIYFDHARPDGSSCFDVLPARFAYGYRRENIAAGQRSAAAVMDGWKNSSGHNANMVADNNSCVGIGAFTDSDGLRYWVQVFSSLQGSTGATQTGGTQAVIAAVDTLPGMLDIRVSPSSAALQAGESATFTASNVNADWNYSTPNIHITYAVSESPDVATVSISEDGKAVVTGVSGGTATLKLGVDGASPYTVDVPVTVSGPAAPGTNPGANPGTNPGATPGTGSGGVGVTVNGKDVVWTDAAPFIDDNDRTMVPLYAVATAIGLDVTWNAAAREAVFTDGSKTIRFPINSSTAYVSGGGEIPMDTAAVIVSDRTYAPIRYLAEYFDYTVDWDAATRTVIIS